MRAKQHRGAAVAAWAVLVALAGHAALAQTVYRWTDENGVVHFADSPPPQRKDYQTHEMPRSGPAPPPVEAGEAAAATPAAGEPAEPAKGPAQIVVSKHEEVGVGPSVQSFTGTVKNEGGAEASDVAISVRVVDPISGDECINAEIGVEPSTLAPGAKGTYETEFEHPCFKGQTQLELHAVWR